MKESLFDSNKIVSYEIHLMINDTANWKNKSSWILVIQIAKDRISIKAKN